MAATHDWAEVLAGALIAGDQALEQEFEARLADSSRLAFRVAYSVLRHREDAEDVAQEAMTRAYRNFRQLRDRDRFRAWLVRVAWRLALDRQRSDQRRRVREADPPPTVQDFRIEADQHQRAARLWAAIDALPEKLRVVIVLAAIEQHRLPEVADLLRLPQGTVKSRLFAARQRLKEALAWLKD
jgi:RNA polymerase sigma-70 factor (ECF subfamily)